MTKYICQNCGDTVDHNEEGQKWDCVICGGRVVPVDENEVIPVDELDEFIELWESKAEEFKQSNALQIRYMGSGISLAMRGLKSEIAEYTEQKEDNNGGNA